MFIALLPGTPPVMPPVTLGADQPYNVPAGTMPFVTSTGVIVNNTPLQVTPVMAVIVADGLTVTVTVNALPGQDPEVVGVTI